MSEVQFQDEQSLTGGSMRSVQSVKTSWPIRLVIATGFAKTEQAATQIVIYICGAIFLGVLAFWFLSQPSQGGIHPENKTEVLRMQLNVPNFPPKSK